MLFESNTAERSKIEGAVRSCVYESYVFMKVWRVGLPTGSTSVVPSCSANQLEYETKGTFSNRRSMDGKM